LADLTKIKYSLNKYIDLQIVVVSNVKFKILKDKLQIRIKRLNPAAIKKQKIYNAYTRPQQATERQNNSDLNNKLTHEQ